jgi:DNA-binding GntR family transcriptional regulator
MTERDEHPFRADRPSAGGRSPAESLSDRAYRELEELIVTLQLIPGEVLSEAALTARLGIGRTPVREALQRLAYEGLVTILPRRGVIVTEINVSRHLALLETRRELERLIMRSAAKRATKAERAGFADLARGFADAAARSDDVTFMRLDRRFNAATIAACRNEYAARAMASMQGLSRRFWYQHYRETLDLKRSAELHQAVAQAIADGDPTAAAAASDALVDHIAEFARATI